MERDMAGTHWEAARHFLQSATQGPGAEQSHTYTGGPQRGSEATYDGWQSAVAIPVPDDTLVMAISALRQDETAS